MLLANSHEMKVAIMQPYFFPYLGYFSLAKNVDRFILLDDVQFIRHGWIERNRILKPNEGWQYIRVPLKKHSRETIIRDVEVDNSQDWTTKILAQLQHYAKAAKHYRGTIELVRTILERSKSDDLVNINKKVLVGVLEYLGIEMKVDVFSHMQLRIMTPSAPDEWALNICLALDGVSEYWNPIGGVDFFSSEKYTNAGIKLRFQKVNVTEYDQRRGNFEPGLSVIDALMFNTKEQVRSMLDDYELV